MTDWRRYQELLLKDSEPLVRALFAENKKRRDVIAAIGYVFEFGRGHLCFDICANTVRNAKKSVADYLAKYPDESPEDFRWNSGDYDYPGAVQDRFGGWSDTWSDELVKLDRLAEGKKHSKRVRDRIADICCNVLAALASRGVFGDCSVIDFNVAALLDRVELVKKRDARIRDLIRSNDKRKPKGAPG